MNAEKTSCPVARTAIILGSRWTAQIIRELLDHGPRRYQDLQNALVGVSPNTLSSRLKMLEESGIVSRMLRDAHPPYADYILTKNGLKMSGIICAMREWGAKNG